MNELLSALYKLDILILFASHGLAAVPFVQSLLRGVRPNTSDFAVLSFILYYDVGLALELLGVPYHSEWFGPLLNADPGTFMLSSILIAAGPWLLHLGSRVADGKTARLPQEPQTGIIARRRPTFYGLLALVSVALAYYGVTTLLSGAPIWLLRLNVTAAWGPLIIILYMPLYILGFYVSQRDSRSWRGLVICLGLAGAIVLSTLVVGERTLILLPFLILALFRFKMTPARLLGAVTVLLLAAGIFLSVFKFSYAQSGLDPGQLVSDTLASDIARAPVLRTVLEQSEPVGTRMLPYPMAGYVYSALFFVPRSLVPFKGVSTGQYYTGRLAGTDPEETAWTLGVGVIEELILNGGLWLVLPGLLLYGMGMGLLDRASRSVPNLVVPTRLAAVWICGYHLTAALGLFGVMAGVGLALHLLFVAHRASHAVNTPLTEQAVHA